MATDVKTLTNKTLELFRTGRRTVSFQDWIEAIGGHPSQAGLIERLVDLVPIVAKHIEEAGVPCTTVNSYCVQYYPEVAITDSTVARRCNAFNSGGHKPVGIRRASPDDLVRAEMWGSQSTLGVGTTRHATQSSANDVARGISEAPSHERLTSTLRATLPSIPDIAPDPVQERLLDSGD